mgnify:CR=1 FL=1
MTMFSRRYILFALMIPALLWACKRPAVSAPAEVASAAQDAPRFDADSAYRYVARQVEFGPRVPGSGSHSQCAEWLAGELKSAGADTVVVQKAQMKAWDGKTLPISNIFAQYNRSAAERILLVAHWDTRPWADEDPDEANHSKPLPGANDGASGVGVLLEVARQLGKNAPAIGVDILLVDAEDYGCTGGDDESSWCLGTQYWVENMPYADGLLPQQGILLDMVGGKGARFHREMISEQANRQLVDRVWAAAADAGFSSIFVNSRGTAVIDDHLFLSRAGIPTIDIIEAVNAETGSFPAIWHTMADDMDSIDARTLGAVGQTVLNVIYNMK